MNKIALVFIGLFLPPFLASGGFAQITPGKRATILLFVGSHCPCTDPHKRVVKSLVEEYQKEGVRFYTVFSNRGESGELASRFMKQTGWDFSFILDRDGKIMNQYGAKLTPEALIVNSRGEVVYRGAIDDSVPNMGQVKNNYLKTALTQLLSGTPVIPTAVPPYGCYIVR